MKPCPFCNSTPNNCTGDGPDLYFCSNDNCPASSVYFTEEQWENRPTEARLIKLNEPVVPTPEDAKYYPTDF